MIRLLYLLIIIPFLAISCNNTPDLTASTASNFVTTENTTTTEPETVKVYTNEQFGFSFEHSSKLYIEENIEGVELRTSKAPIDLGGVQPPGKKGVDWTDQGYKITVVVTPYKKVFSFDQWFKEQYPYSTLDKKQKIVVANQEAVQYTSRDEIGAGNPNVILYHANNLYQINFASGSDEAEGLKVFDKVTSSFKFTN